MSKKKLQRQNKKHLRKVRQNKKAQLEEKIKNIDLPDGHEIKVSVLNITYDPMPASIEKELNKKDLKSLEDCYAIITTPSQRKHLQDTINLLEALKEKYQNTDRIYNYLGIAYGVNREPDKADAIKKEAYEKNPDYLFAKLAYAQVCIESRNYEEIPIIFNNQFDLPLLYPKRKKFHISEASSFYCIIGLYFCQTDNKTIAKTCLNTLQKIDAEKRYITSLKRCLAKKGLSNFLGKFK
ncbi:MAG: hypothetical protein GQ569_01835 [Methylococcaceae bacterium]|nr:hypothetical protein [Methylococcaceae bacterium]